MRFLSTFPVLALSLALIPAACHHGPSETSPERPRQAAENGSSSVLEEEDLRNRPVTRFEELLQARVAGVRVIRLANGDFRVQVRGINNFHGTSEPLFVIDGVPVSDRRTLVGLNPVDVVRIEVLKDGTAAAYGSRGANGVILITTKRP